MKRMIMITMLACIALLTASCTQALKDALADGYQFGDFTAAELRNLEKYCGDELAMARTAIRSTAGLATQGETPISVCESLQAWKDAAEESVH